MDRTTNVWGPKGRGRKEYTHARTCVQQGPCTTMDDPVRGSHPDHADSHHIDMVQSNDTALHCTMRRGARAPPSHHSLQSFWQ